MSDNEDKEFMDVARKIIERSAPKIKESEIFLSIVTPNFANDPQCVLQIGLAVLLDKPICLIVDRDTAVPENLKKCAVAIERVDRSQPDSMTAAMEAINRAMDKYEKEKLN